MLNDQIFCIYSIEISFILWHLLQFPITAQHTSTESLSGLYYFWNETHFILSSHQLISF